MRLAPSWIRREARRQGRFLFSLVSTINRLEMAYIQKDSSFRYFSIWHIMWVENGITFHSFRDEEIGELLAKNIARTTRIQLDGRHQLYLQNWTTLYLLNLLINRQLKMNLTSMEVCMFFSLFLNKEIFWMSNKTHRLSYHVKNYGDRGGWSPSRPSISVIFQMILSLSLRIAAPSPKQRKNGGRVRLYAG